QTHQNEWTLLYQDSLAQVWGRRDLFDNPECPRYLSPSRRQIGDEQQHGYVAWPATPVVKRAPASQMASR
ncbi:MAG: hypothetical protein KDA58_05600, partial [Planctomycetaceae bacterium]|nr:hypothetical protein [Planctomycetaceae bacterium]